MRAVHTVHVRRHSAGTKDAHGNARDVWADPVPLLVYGIASKGSQEPGPGRDAVTADLLLFLTPETVLGPHDLVVIDGEEWKVAGRVSDYTRGPFGFRPGKTVALTREDG